jgi:ABC-type branched-subunit amino acid transport system substrate-binding protein
MGRRGMAAVSMACAVALVVSACGSDDEEGGASAGGGGGNDGSLDIGVLTSLSGPASGVSSAVVDGVDARFQAYEADGGECADAVDFTIVEGDDASSPQGALAAAQQLVQQDEVYALIEESSVFFGATGYLTTQAADTPVIGGAFDGAPEWLEVPDNNLIPNFPVQQFDDVYSTIGEGLARLGATQLAGVAYNSPSSAGALENVLTSAEAAGVERAYVNDTVPLASTDVGGVVLGIIDSGADAVFMTLNPDTAFAVIAGLRQANYPLKGILLAAGYGGELLQSPPGVQLGQGVTFTSAWTPVEIETEATAALSQAMRDYAGIPSGVPGFFAAMGWFGADVVIHGLELAGCDASQEEFLTALRSDDTWDAGGMYPNPIPFDTIDYEENCTFFLTLTGDAFVPIEGASPICGELIEG